MKITIDMLINGVLSVLMTLFAGCSADTPDTTGNETIVCAQVDPLEKIFREQKEYTKTGDPVAVAKGETASFQFVINSPNLISTIQMEAGDMTMGSIRIPVTTRSFIGYVRIPPEKNVGNGAASDRIISADGYYPDPLPETTSKGVKSNTNQPVYISYNIPRNAAAGNYTAEIVFSGETQGKKFRITKTVTAKVYNVTLPEQTLLVTQWFSSLDALSCMNNNQAVPLYSDKYFRCFEVLVNKARDYGQNVFQVLTIHRIKYTLTGNTYTFDFTVFDRLVELFIQQGNAKRIEGHILAKRFSEAGAGWTGPFGVYVPTPDQSAIGATFNLLPLSDPRAKNFLNQFLPALYNHLLAKGWDRLYLQHVADEPLPENAASYNEIAAYIKSVVPQFRLIDAICTPDVTNTIDIPVPRLDILGGHYGYFRQAQAQGKELWYTILVHKLSYRIIES
jgi:hypothetical protein